MKNLQTISKSVNTYLEFCELLFIWDLFDLSSH